MRRLLVAPLVAALLPAVAQAAPRPLAAPVVGTVGGARMLVTSPKAAYAAWQASPTEVVVRTDRGVVTTHTVPPECSRLTAAAADVVTLDCGYGTPQNIGVLHLDSGQVERLSVTTEFGGGLSVEAAGRRWFQLRAQTAIVEPRSLLHRATGRLVPLLDDPYGPRRAIDLDAASGSVPLCRGLRRSRIDPFKAPAEYGPATVVNRRALVVGEPFTDCRTGRTFKRPDGFNARYRLRDGVATRFADGRRFAVPRGAFSFPQLSRGTAWTLDAAAGTVTAARLP